MEQEGKNKIYILICEILYQYQPSRWIATQIHITWMIKWKKNQTVEGNGGAASGSGPLEEKNLIHLWSLLGFQIVPYII